MSQRTKKTLLLAQDRLNTHLSFLKNCSTEEPDILVQNKKNTSVIIYNRPKQLNAFKFTMFEAISNHLKEFESSKYIDMIFLEGRGRAFGTGVDIKDVFNIITEPLRRTEFYHCLQIIFNMTYFIGTMKTPIICFMDGLTVGGTCIYSALSHFSIATENTKISLPETRFGNFCDVGASFVLPRLNGNIGKYLALTSKTLVAEDVLFSGMATHFVPSSLLVTLKKALVNLQNPSVELINQTIEMFAVKPGHIPTNHTLHGDKRKIINRCFQFDTVPEILNALKKEGSKFSLETIGQINKGSPRAIALTLENIRRGSNLSLEHCLRIDFKLWQILPFEDDFYHGILSVINKEKKTQWSHKNCYAIDFEKDILARYFNAEVKESLKLSSDNKDRYFTTQGRKFGLPTEKKVKQVKQENNLESDETVIAWFTDQRSNKYGVREEVKEILIREKNIV